MEATSPGVVGAAVFAASAELHAPAKVSVDSGNLQIGIPGQPLPRPFVAVVTDDGHNRLPGIPVTFAIVTGGGDFSGETQVTATTDTDGRAVAVLTLGPIPGNESNVVSATVENLSGLPAVYTATSLAPGDPANTRISGIVMDNQNQPIEGATLRIRGTANATQTNTQGLFQLSNVPVGDVHLEVDGSTVQRPGTYPDLEFEMITVPGADNTLGMPVYLLPLDEANSIFVDETQGGTLTLPDYPGFSLTVEPGAATFPDGTRHGTISVTVVHADKVPMIPNFGQQPRFIVTIQPPGVRFEPPARITHPNVDGLAPGQITELYSFDHDMGSFVATGTATVSNDGTQLVSDPGTGIIKGGWHCGGDPSPRGTAAKCPECAPCDGVNCLPKPKCSSCSPPGSVCVQGACLTGTAALPSICDRVTLNTTGASPEACSAILPGLPCGAALKVTYQSVTHSCGSVDLAGALLTEKLTMLPTTAPRCTNQLPITGLCVVEPGGGLVSGQTLGPCIDQYFFCHPPFPGGLPPGVPSTCEQKFKQEIFLGPCLLETHTITLSVNVQACQGGSATRQ